MVAEHIRKAVVAGPAEAAWPLPYSIVSLRPNTSMSPTSVHRTVLRGATFFGFIRGEEVLDTVHGRLG